MFNRARHDDEVAFAEFDSAVTKIYSDAATKNKKSFVLICVRVPIKHFTKFGNLHLRLVHVADNMRIKNIRNLLVNGLDNIQFYRRHERDLVLRTNNAASQ
jgi:hypothetical protein